MLTPISGIKIQNKHRRRSCQLSIQYGHLFHSVNAASLALINAGIPTRGVLVASSASMAWRGAEPQPLVDVGHVEEAAGGVCLTVAAMPTIGSIALLEMSHRLHMDYFDLVFSRAMQGCKDIQKQRTKLNQYHHLLRYKLLDRFKSIVAGFADSYALAADKCKATVKSVSLRVAGAGPARRGLFGGEQQEVGAGGEGAAASKDMVETARSWARPTYTPASVRAAVAVARRREEARHAAAAAAGRRRAALLAAAGRLDQPQAGRYAPMRALTHCGRAPRGEARHAAAAAAGRRRAALLAAAGRLDQPQAGRYAPTACSVHTAAARAREEARHAAAAAAGRRRAALLAAAGRLDQPQAGRYAPTACSVHTAAARPREARHAAARLLADAGLLYSQLQDAWTNHKLEGLEKQMAALSVSAKEEDIKELIDIFDCHFDPAKEPKGPKPRTPRNRIRVCQHIYIKILNLLHRYNL
ncbi:hypothetical protein MSG28_012716 [Choristoneura fumiferana]|uniref:Uncharacterized protein n=1 Tax=Choristoneura fumiferana TaxID=7141 RepID=A0ACC0JI02_CHOFU|nr:hypothetical protein MSG28_012716 [Choristoneura fumiferana]